MEIKELAPVVLFVYNRPKHAERLLNSLAQNGLARDTVVYIYSDAAKNEKSIDGVNEVRSLIANYQEKHQCFKKVIIKRAEKNQGLAKSIIDGVTEVIHAHHQVIVLEDDLIVSSNFLEYMNNALDYYRDKEDIWSITGYSYPLKSLSSYPHDIYMSGRGCSWSWATWKDRWDTVDWDVDDYEKIKNNIFIRHGFARFGVDLPLMLDARMYGENNSWAIKWCYSAYKQKRLTVYPKTAKTQNGGADGSGTHFSASTTRFDTKLDDGDDSVKFEHIQCDRTLIREMRTAEMGHIQALKGNIRWFLIRNGLLKNR